MHTRYSLYVFFFQAEDGIRDDLVTGVQTCALPISISAAVLLYGFAFLFGLAGTTSLPGIATYIGSSPEGTRLALIFARSEERRVGKECRYWGVRSGSEIRGLTKLVRELDRG